MQKLHSLFIFLLFVTILVFNPVFKVSWAESSEINGSEEPISLPSEIKKIPLPFEIKKIMWDYCLKFDENESQILQFIGKRPDSNLPKSEIAKQFWQTVPIKLISDTPEFKSLKGQVSSITHVTGITATSCPPLTSLTGNFTSVNGEKHKFQLEYSPMTFRYKIDDMLPQYQPLIPSPLIQFKSGLTADIVQCKENLVLVVKATNDSPACVKPASVTKLVAWGWAKPV